jgi:RND family efflux transporter MFP subunit
MKNADRLADLRIDRSAEAPSTSNGRGGLIAVLVLLALAGAGYFLLRDGAPAVTLAEARQSATAGGTASVLDGSGYVTARREAVVSSKVTGKVLEILVEEGMEVREGQVLARLDDSLVRRAYEVAEAERESTRAALAETKALLTEAELALERTHSLVAQGFASRADLDAAIARRESLAARLERERRQLDTAASAVALRRQELDDMTIRAPFTGVAVSKDAQPGEMISPVSAGGGFTRTGVATIVDMGSLEIEVDVNEAYIQRVAPDQPVVATLDAYPDWKIPARVITLVPTADRQKATVKVRIGFEQLDPRILPDMAVKVSFGALENADSAAPAPRPAVLVPRTAVVERDGAAVVFAARNLVVERRAVTVGATQGNDVEIVAGVSAGERVVVDPPAELADGDRIREKQS